MKKAIVLTLSVVLLLGLASCGGSKAKKSTGKPFEGEHVVNAAYVKEHLDEILLYDARGEQAANKETVAKAVPVSWQYLAKCDEGVSGDAGWGTILEPEELGKRLGKLGCDPSKEIVVFADAENGWGEDGRIAWELLAAGYENVKIVDGGFSALKEEGLETNSGGKKPKAVSVTIESIDRTHDIDTEELQRDYDKYKIVDTRAKDEYEGAVNYGEKKGGRLPGATHLWFRDLLNEDGTLKSNEEITKLLEKKGLAKDDPIVVYCTGGIRSAHMELVMRDLGYANVKNYDESFYRWCAVGKLEK